MFNSMDIINKFEASYALTLSGYLQLNVHTPQYGCWLSRHRTSIAVRCGLFGCHYLHGCHYYVSFSSTYSSTANSASGCGAQRWAS